MNSYAIQFFINKNVSYQFKFKSNRFTDIASKSAKVLGMIKTVLGPCKSEVKETAYMLI